MRNLRNAMLIAVVATTAVAAIVGFFLGGPPTRLLVDAGLAIALAVIVGVMLSPTLACTDSLVEGLRALARGDRHQRLNPDLFAGLGDVARAANEVAASLAEGEDANLGPVKSVPRVKTQRRPPSIVNSEHPEIGTVRKLARPETSSAASDAPQANKTRVLSAPPEDAAASLSDVLAYETRTPATGATGNDTSIDSAPRERADNEHATAKVPSLAELEGLFADFVAAKKARGDGVQDLDADAFTQTILGECERLMAAHRCKGVRFEITEQDGEVSLRPRLLR